MRPSRKGSSVPFGSTPGGTYAPPAPILSQWNGDLFAAVPDGQSDVDDPPTSSWRLYSSATGIGTPDSNPSEWFGPIGPDEDDSRQATWLDLPTGHYYILQAVIQSWLSQWSPEIFF